MEAKGKLMELRQRQAQMVVSMSSLSAQFSRGLAVFSGLGKGKEVAVVGARRRRLVQLPRSGPQRPVVREPG